MDGRWADEVAKARAALEVNDSSDWRYVPLRRLSVWLENSIDRATQWAAAEPNDEALWHRIRLHVGALMDALYRDGAFNGSSPGEAYEVHCDAETTTQEDVDRGKLNIEVGFAPLQEAELVVLRIGQWMRRPPG